MYIYSLHNKHIQMCFFLQNIKETITKLKPSVDSIDQEKERVTQTAKREQADQIIRVTDKLREEWSQVNHAFSERYR